MPFDDASLAIAALGGYLPMPGGLEPADREWTYREQLDRLGPASFVSAALLVSLLGAIVLFDPFSALGVSSVPVQQSL